MCLEQPASSHGVKPFNVVYCHWCTWTDLLWRHWWSNACPPPGPRDLHLWPSWWRRHRCWYPPRPPLSQQEVVTPWRWTQTAITLAWVWLEDEAPDVAIADYTWTFTLGQFWGRKEKRERKGSVPRKCCTASLKIKSWLFSYLLSSAIFHVQSIAWCHIRMNHIVKIIFHQFKSQVTTSQIQTDKRFKRTLLIRTKHKQLFRVTPFSKGLNICSIPAF